MAIGKAFVLLVGLSFYNVSRNIVARLPENMLSWSLGDWVYVLLVAGCGLICFSIALSQPTRHR